MSTFKYLSLIAAFLMLQAATSQALSCLRCFNEEGCVQGEAPSVDCQEAYGDSGNEGGWTLCMKVVKTCKY